MDLTDSLLRRVLTDPETGLCNRNAFRLDMERTLERARRYGFPVSVVTFRWEGDEPDAVSKLARCLAPAVRGSDCLARTGERELQLLLTHEDAGRAERVAERLQQLTDCLDSIQPSGVQVETVVERGERGA